LFFDLWIPQVIYGWDMQQIINAIRSRIKSSYNGSLRIDFTTYGSKVYIRSDNAVSPMGSFGKFQLKVLHSDDSGRWEVCGSAYPLKQWVPTSFQVSGFGGFEGEWFRICEDVIIQAVNTWYHSPIPLA
jgi:hypothetical protein